MAIRRRTGLIGAVIAALLLLALIFVGPALIKVNRYGPQVISYLQEKTGKQVEIGRLALTFFPVAIHIDHFALTMTQVNRSMATPSRQRKSSEVKR